MKSTGLLVILASSTCCLSMRDAPDQTLTSNPQMGPSASHLEVGATDLEHTLLSMARSSSSRGANVSAFVTSIQPLLDSIASEINTSHSASQSILDSHETAFASCSTTKQQAFQLGGAVAVQQTTVDSANTTHSQCRGTEATKHADYTKCEEDLTPLQSNKDYHCGIFNTLDATTPKSDPVAPQTSEKYKDWLDRVKIWVVAELLDYDGKSTNCTNAMGPYNTKQTECTGTDGAGGKLGALTAQKSTCDANQGTLEQEACSLATQVTTACTNEISCWDNSKSTYDGEEKGLQDQEKSRKDQYTMVQRIGCYLDVFVAAGDGLVDETQLNTCQSKTYTEPAYLSLTWPQIPVRPDQCQAPIQPCDQSWTDQFYKSLPTDAPAKECIKCAQQSTGASLGTSAQDSTTALPSVGSTSTAPINERDIAPPVASTK